MLYTLEMASGCRVLCMAPGREDRKVGTHVGIRLRAGSFNAFPK
jgi:hypothetical protein